MKSVALALLLLIAGFNVRTARSFVPSLLCTRIPGLTSVQKQLCVEAPDAVVSLASGQLLGATECQKQFQGHRWNCSQAWNRDRFGQVVIVGSKEAAYTYGITSAGAVYSITAACAKGNITICGCDTKQKMLLSSKSENWKWGGCSVDISFGMRFTKKFLDAREIENDMRSQMNLHNNRVGRKVVQRLLRTDCKCHGVSGSCAMKTCWKSLPSFHLVGDQMMKKYRKAKLVQMTPEALTAPTATTASGEDRISGWESNPFVIANKSKAQQLRGDSLLRPKKSELVYLHTSPNYCDRNVSTGILGTVGRQCNRTSTAVDRCDLLCCGRGYNTHQILRSWQCNCKFKWCCTVTCDVCTEQREEYTCK